MGRAIEIVLSGKAQVVCVHNWEKRQVTTEQQVIELAAVAGFVFQPGIHKIHLCPCCDNLFGADGVTERYCSKCSIPPFHPLGGPLAEPKGVVG
jgi:hypothetical protein